MLSNAVQVAKEFAKTHPDTLIIVTPDHTHSGSISGVINDEKPGPLREKVGIYAEAGYPKVEVLNWQGLIAPKGTPKAIIDQLNAAANEALKDPQLRELMLSQGNEIGGGSPADFSALIKSESAKWSAVVKTANIKPE
jgi:tripartite-type tricarboxylate transporter receptor subunit TctC